MRSSFVMRGMSLLAHAALYGMGIGIADEDADISGQLARGRMHVVDVSRFEVIHPISAGRCDLRAGPHMQRQVSGVVRNAATTVALALKHHRPPRHRVELLRCLLSNVKASDAVTLSFSIRDSTVLSAHSALLHLPRAPPFPVHHRCVPSPLIISR
jgi:hypothetical protein